MRTRLPNRRPSITFDFACSTGGRLGEIFLSNHKSNSAADIAERDAAIACSIALQHSADPVVIRRALWRNTDGRASGPLGAALDLVAGGAA